MRKEKRGSCGLMTLIRAGTEEANRIKIEKSQSRQDEVKTKTKPKSPTLYSQRIKGGAPTSKAGPPAARS